MSAPVNTLRSKVLTCAAIVVIGAGLHFAQALFVPLVVALLLSLILSPLANFGERLHLPRPISVILVVVVVFGCLGLAGYLVAGQAASLARSLPEYRSNALAKLNAIRVPFVKTMNRVQEALKEAESATAAGQPKPPPDAEDPVKVEVVEPGPSPFTVATVVGGILLDAIGATTLVMLLVIFFLIYKDDIRDRVLRLAGDAQVSITNETMSDATKGVSRFLSLQAILNVAYGTVFGAALFVMGVPGALLWGVIATILRFVPYVGPIVAASLPILLSIGVFPGWSRPLMVAGVILIIELIQNNVIETVVYGKRAGLSPVAVVLAAVFWTWMWGGVGLILSVPLTLCLVTVGKHLPSLQFIAVALGDGPALEPRVQIYHRLLGRMQGQAAELLEKELRDRGSLEKFCDEIVLPIIRMAETDIRQDKLDEEKALHVFRVLQQIVDDLAETVQAEDKRVPERGKRLSVGCLSAGSLGDELSANLLAQVLRINGCDATVFEIAELDRQPQAERLGRFDALVICISPPSNLLRVRNLYRQVRRRFGEIPILQGLWGNGDPQAVNGRLAPDGKAVLVSTFVDARKKIADLAASAQGAR